MRQPIGLYLAEFAPAGPVTVASGIGLPCFDAVAPADDFVVPLLDADPAPFDQLPEEPAVAEDVEVAPSPPEPDTATVVEALMADHVVALEAARQSWIAHEGGVLAARFTTALDDFTARIADALAPLLEPFLVRGAQLTALAQLRDMLGTLLDGGEGAVAVSGPADLLSVLRTACGGRPGLVFTEGDLPDVTITAGDTRIQSQLAGWARALESALEPSLGAAA